MANSIFLLPGIGQLQGGSISFDGSVNATSGITTDASNNGTFFVSAAGTTWGGVSRAVFNTSADGLMKLFNNGGSIGSLLKVDALPTIGANFGSSPSVVTGSTPLAGAVNVGTGGTAVSGTVTFGGTAFTAAPFVTCTCSSGAVPTIATSTVSGITFTTSVAWPASTILSWHAISSAV